MEHYLTSGPATECELIEMVLPHHDVVQQSFPSHSFIVAERLKVNQSFPDLSGESNPKLHFNS